MLRIRYLSIAECDTASTSDRVEGAITKTPATLAAIIFFILGLLAYPLLCDWGIISSRRPVSVAQHWQLVQRFRRDVQDHSGKNIAFSEAGFERSDPITSLTALEAAGELVHVNLVLPNVPRSREANLYWMNYVWKRPDIVFATGNPAYVDYKPSGEAPLHLELWFKPIAQPDVQQLIQDLEALAAKDKKQPPADHQK